MMLHVPLSCFTSDKTLEMFNTKHQFASVQLFGILWNDHFFHFHKDVCFMLVTLTIHLFLRTVHLFTWDEGILNLQKAVYKKNHLFLLPGQNLVPTLPKMQLDCRQFGLRFGCVMLVVAKVASSRDEEQKSGNLTSF